MRAYLAAAHNWIPGAIAGVLFGGGMTIWQQIQRGGSWPLHIAVGVFAGLFFGAIMGRFFKREFGPSRTALAALPRDERRIVMRAATRRPAPLDARVRQAALRQAEASRGLLQRRSRFNLAVFSVALVGYAVLALTATPWWWAAFAMFAALLLVQLSSRRWIERRIAILSDKPDAELR